MDIVKKQIARLAVTIFVILFSAAAVYPKGAIHPVQESELILGIRADLKEFEKLRPDDRVYLMFDKPFYYPGETIWFQAYVRNSSDMKPSLMSEILHVEFVAPSGNVDKEMSLIVRDGTAGGDISLDRETPGGLYKVRAWTNWQKNENSPTFYERDIQIQSVVLPNLKMKLEFEKEAYGKGEEVRAGLWLETLANKPLKNLTCPFLVRIKGRTILEKSVKTDRKGYAQIRFSLPENLDSADGLLNVMVPWQGRTESISRSVPVLLNNLSLCIFPEGGDTVAGFSSVIAVRVVDEFGKPADIRAVVETEQGKKITSFKTFHQGLGSFSLKPEAGRNYFIRILSPAGVEKRFKIPEALSRGYTLALEKKDNEKIDIIINSTEIETLAVVAKSRGREIKTFSFTAKKGENRLSTETADFPMGVVLVTLFDSKRIERAERLVFVNTDKKMRIDIKTDREKYLPREKVKLNIRTFDERGLPLPAQLSLSVADDGLISFADAKEGNILSKLLLEPELKTEVYEPDFYFDEKEEKAEKAMDLLMLTHGWRRFTWKEVFDIKAFSPSHQPEKAEIKGIVLSNRYGGEPVAGAKVKSTLTGKTVLTDKEGRFVFRDIDLYEGETLTASGMHNTGSVWVSDYNKQVTIYLRDGRIMKRKWLEQPKGVMPMVGGEPEMIDGMIVEEAALPPVMAVADNEPEPGQIAADKNVPAADFVMEKIRDGRFMKKEIAVEEAAQRKNAPVYCRAREFPAPVYETTKTDRRTDFRSTVFWKGDIETDRRGTAEIEFYNSDQITAFRATVEGIGTDGLVGRNEEVYAAQLPFSIDVKIPVEVTMGDTLQLPLTISNNTGEAIRGTLKTVAPASLKLTGSIPKTIRVLKNNATTLYMPFEVLNIPGESVFKAEFRCGNDRDAFSKTISVAPKGFPVSISVSGQEKKKSFKVRVSKPVEGTVKAGFTAYPTVLSDLLKGIESILREPHGCFEQASSSTYPNIMVTRYLDENDHKEPAIKKKAADFIEKGYKRLVSYETGEKGYEWFGSAPGHEALTAYGLMEFVDMRGVFDGVDEEMIKRTGKWLLEKRDGKGGFIRNQRALDSFGRASEEITNAYIVYALSEAGFVFEIKKELEKACETAEKSDDPYQLGLVTNALFNVKDNRAEAFLKKLMKHQQADGSWTGKTKSITCSSGKALGIETTSLAVIAALKGLNKDNAAIRKGVEFIIASRSSSGGFGNTQSTILALKALVDYTKFSRRTAESGTIEVMVNGEKAADLSYEEGIAEEISIPAEKLSPFFRDGEQNVEIRYLRAKNPLPYTFSLNYSTLVPASSDLCDVGLSVDFGTDEIKTGETVRMKTVITNRKKDDGLPMTIAVIGIPGGLSPQPWQLKELQEKKSIDYYEVSGNSVAFYYRQMKPGEKREVNLDLKGEIPGIFTGAASSAYLYYTNEFKTWVGGKPITVKK